jgi:hypothetical protein
LDAHVRGRIPQIDHIVKNKILETQKEAKVINDYELANIGMKGFDKIFDTQKHEALNLLKTGAKGEDSEAKGEEARKVLKDYQTKNLQVLEKHETAILLLSKIYNEQKTEWNEEDKSFKKLEVFKKKLNDVKD